MSSFARRVVLITGAGSGIGRQLALELARAGAAVAALDLRPELLEALAKDLSGRRHAWATADVTDRTGLREAVAQLGHQLGPIDLLIASAGIGIETPGLDFHAEDFETIVRVNLIGVANSIDAVLPGMLSRRSGHLAALSSVASYRGLPRLAGYCASKAGVNALLDALRVELRPHGIAVTTLCPGWVRTPMTEALALPAADVLSPGEAAQHILRALRRRQAFCAFPSRLAWRARLLRWLPCGASDWLTRRTIDQLAKKGPAQLPAG